MRRSGECAADPAANKISLAFALENKPGTLVKALEKLAAAGADLTKIESRPVPGKPWEYIILRGRESYAVSLAVADKARWRRCRRTAASRWSRNWGRYKAA